MKQNSLKLFILALALLVGASSASVAQAQTAQPSAPTSVPAAQSTAPQAAPEKVLPAQNLAAQQASLVTEFEVNGLKVLVKRRAGSQTVVAGLFLRGGARNITAENAGIEALMLDSASEASLNYPRERMRRELSRMGTSISYGVNYDYSAFTLASTRANFDRSWDIFTDVTLRPTFAREDVERVRNRLVVSLSDDTDVPDSYLQLLQSKIAYAGHPYLNHPQGTAQSVSRLTVEDLRRYHQQMMQTSRLLLVIVGDLDAEVIRRRVTDSLAKLPRGNYQPVPLPPLTFDAPTVEITQRTLPTNYVQGVFTAPSLNTADIYPMRIASTILQNRVLVEVRYRRNLSYAPDAFLSSQSANVGGIYVTAVDANQAVRVMLDEITKLQREPISQEDITSTVQHFLTRHYLGQETNAAQAGELAQYELIGGGWRNSLNFIERLRAVTPADVQRVARTYMRNIRFVVLGNPESIDKTIFIPRTGE
ncbi:MAG TPA: pitrilysin family protein [Pyrinomonadaceae bacterium]|jgi:zinc protease